MWGDGLFPRLKELQNTFHEGQSSLKQNRARDIVQMAILRILCWEMAHLCLLSFQSRSKFGVCPGRKHPPFMVEENAHILAASSRDLKDNMAFWLEHSEKRKMIREEESFVEEGAKNDMEHMAWPLDTPLHTQYTLEVVWYLDFYLQQTREIKQTKKEPRPLWRAQCGWPKALGLPRLCPPQRGCDLQLLGDPVCFTGPYMRDHAVLGDSLNLSLSWISPLPLISIIRFTTE